MPDQLVLRLRRIGLTATLNMRVIQHVPFHGDVDDRKEVTCEARAACSTSSNLAGRRGTDETVCGV